MNKFLNSVLWSVLFILLLPSSLAVASWNSLPGSQLFRVKLFMEQALVLIVPTAQAKGDLQIAYTERRFSEAKRLLADRTSVQGLSYLDSQIGVTKDAILSTKDPVVKKQLAQKYVATLREVKVELQQQKEVLAPEPTRPVPTSRPTEQPTPTPTPTSTATTQDPGGSIDDTIGGIDKTISDLTTTSMEETKGNGEGSRKDEKQKDGENGQGDRGNSGGNERRGGMGKP